MLAAATIPSPVGDLVVTATPDGALASLRFGAGPAGGGDRGAFAFLRGQLERWFAGEITSFEVPLAPAGTPWQRAVWAALLTVPYGETVPYTELAARAGRPGAARAAGAANGRNPISILIPCHRVVGTDGGLTGYAGGLDAKAWLLAHERRVREARAAPAGAAR